VEARAGRAIAVGEEANGTFAAARALSGLWLSHGVSRNHAATLEYIERALQVIVADPAARTGYHGLDIQQTAMHRRIFTLPNLDRWPEATALNLVEVDRSTTDRSELTGWMTGVCKTPRQPIGAQRPEASCDLAKVRVAGSNPVVRSPSCWNQTPSSAHRRPLTRKKAQVRVPKEPEWQHQARRFAAQDRSPGT